ncbi:MAG TPA: hypothetical protein VNI01_08605 [Elusimicrobiota bacterium]|jgi:hypothetical protein|nr:hypothetical protein [Elusimicrobiota bacterium]
MLALQAAMAGLLFAAAAPAAWEGRADVARIAQLLEGTPREARMREVLQELDRDPDDLDARRKLKDAVEEAFRSDLQRLREAGRPDAPASKGAEIRRTAYRILLLQAPDPWVRTACSDGYDAFEGGKYVTAAERVILCRKLFPDEDWLWTYTPLIRRLFRYSLTASKAHPRRMRYYNRIAMALFDEDWGSALDGAEMVVNYLSSKHDPANEIPQWEALERRVRPRIDVQKRPDGLAYYSEHARTLLKSDPEKAVDELEAVYLSHVKMPDDGKEVERLLREAYLQRALRQGLRQVDEARAAGDPALVARSLGELLRRDPANEETLRLVQKSGSSEPALLQAQAYYDRGLQAYVQGDLARASKEWRDALAADPGFKKADKALARATKELSLKKPAP